MPWVRFDDQFPIHRKVKGLSDSAFRLHAEAIFWCARNLTDGFVPAEDLPELATARRPLKLVPELVSRGSWHQAAEVCDSETCPAHPKHRPDAHRDGWYIHDYFDYQPSKQKVQRERKAKLERQQRWRERKSGRPVDNRSDDPVDASTDASTGVRNARLGTDVDASTDASQSTSLPQDIHRSNRTSWDVRGRRSGRDASVDASRDAAPYPHPPRRKRGRVAPEPPGAPGRASPPGSPVRAVPDWCGECDERTRQVEVDGIVHRCPICHPLRDEEIS